MDTQIDLNRLRDFFNEDDVDWKPIAVSKKTGKALAAAYITNRAIMDRLDEVLNERTRLVAVTAMSNVTGTINPIKELARRAHQVGALISVDGAQSVPHQATDVRDLDVDFLAFSGHKLFGPSGIGVLYGKHPLLEAMDPLLYGGHMIERVTATESTWAAPPSKFEAGTAPIAQCVALSAAIDYLTNLGFGAIGAHERDLTEYAHAQLEQISGLRIYGPPTAQKGAIVSFTIDGAHPVYVGKARGDRAPGL